jgi:hypothetical protein
MCFARLLPKAKQPDADQQNGNDRKKLAAHYLFLNGDNWRLSLLCLGDAERITPPHWSVA